MYVAPAPTLSDMLRDVPAERLTTVMSTLMDLPNPSEYIHWDKLRHLEPPQAISHQEWWMSIKASRVSLRRPLPLTDVDGRPFRYLMTDEVMRLLHFADQRCSGEIAMSEVVTADGQARQHYLVNSLMEEAIRSSQLEGATTSRRVAKELLETGREPRDRSEQMIANNYRALRFIRESIGDELTPSVVRELQRILTEGTLDNDDAAGRLQTPKDERVAIFDRLDGSLVYRPPPARQLPERMKSLCRFANADDDEAFLHPVVRSILLHFQLAYDHPFEDGNGRTARALFYWSMRKHGYWLAEYLSISRILRQAPAQYTRAFLYTETDEQDTTYFIFNQLEVLRRAVDELHEYLERKIREANRVQRLIQRSDGFNYRQLALLSDAMKNPDRRYNFGTHAAKHGVTHETARTDLRELEAEGLLVRRRGTGRRYQFAPAPDMADELRHFV